MEYILILVITVALILGIMSQFSDAFSRFLDNYFGDYIACLLETGELPSFGGDGFTSGECNAQFEAFSVSNGRPRIADNGSGDGGGDGSGGDSSGGGDGDGDGDGSDGSGSSRNGRPARLSSSGGSSNGESFGSNQNSLRPSSQLAKAPRSRANDVTGGGDSNSSEGGFGAGRGRGKRSRRRVIYLGDEYLTEDEKKKQNNRVIGRSKKSKSQKEIDDLRKAKFRLEVPEQRQVASDDEDEGGLSFGHLIKYLLILGILIAIFIFLGGQALQIKKSWQKAE